MKTLIEKRSFGDLYLTFIVEVPDGLQHGDTVVKIEDEIVCCISWDQRDNLSNELNYIIDAYRI